MSFAATTGTGAITMDGLSVKAAARTSAVIIPCIGLRVSKLVRDVAKRGPMVIATDGHKNCNLLAHLASRHPLSPLSLLLAVWAAGAAE